MAVRKIVMRPPGSGDYGDELYPKTSADHVTSTDGTVQGDINTLKSGKANTSHTHTKSQITDFPTLATVATSGSYSDLSNVPSTFAPSAHNHTKAQITDFPTLGTASAANTGTSSGNVPVLDGSGKLNTSVLPAIAITDTFVVANQTAMLALTAEVGDIAVRTDLNKSFILKTAGASVLANWQELLTPTDVVTSVAGKTGIVTLVASDVGLGNVTNESKATMFTNPAFTGNPTAPTPSTADNDTSIATTAFVKAQGYITGITKANVEAVLTGTISTHTHSGLMPADHASNHITGGDDIIPAFTDVASGLVPASGGGSGNYLRADGAWATPPNTVYTHPTTDGNKHLPAGGTTGQFVKYAGTAGTGAWADITLADIDDYAPPITIGTVQPTNGSLWFQEIV